MSSYREQRRWSDKYMPAVKAIVGPRLMTESSEFRDKNEATDLIVITARSLDIACRVRQRKYLDDYRFEFTIRQNTEMNKIIAGFGHWMFYGFVADDNEPDLGFCGWHIIDLDKLRASMIYFSKWRADKSMPKPYISTARSNGDNTSFRAFQIPTFQDKDIIVDSSMIHEIPWIDNHH